jgi:hypothetical protein
MKIFIILSICIGLLLLISSCSTSAKDTSSPNCAEQTNRYIEVYRIIQPGMNYSEICRIVGQPDQDIGSGIHVLQYRLHDGTSVLIGFSSMEQVLYVYHEEKNNQGEWEIIERIVGTE